MWLAQCQKKALHAACRRGVVQRQCDVEVCDDRCLVARVKLLLQPAATHIYFSTCLQLSGQMRGGQLLGQGAL